MEVWKDVPGYEGFYQASTHGRIRSLDRIDCANRRLKGQLLSQCNTRGGYKMVGFCKDGEHKLFRVNRLIALTFIPNPNNLPHVGHDDDNNINNRVENLYWTDCKENSVHNGKNIRQRNATGKTIVGIKGEEKIIFPSSKEAGRSGFNSSAIRNCLTGRSQTHRGFVWNYV